MKCENWNKCPSRTTMNKRHIQAPAAVSPFLLKAEVKEQAKSLMPPVGLFTHSSIHSVRYSSGS